MSVEMSTSDFYWRRDDGPVQCTRVWDRPRFMASCVFESQSAKEPWKFRLATEAEYRAQRVKR